jgi:1-phosphofructokinase
VSNRVFCVTLNTAIDHIIDVDRLAVGSTIRAAEGVLVPAGKGVDVAVGVATLGCHAVAAGFIGDRSRELFATLQAEQVESMFIEVPGSTRINVTILERESSRETHLQTVGYAISQTDVERLILLIDANVTPDDVVVIGGSLPPGAPDGLLAELIALCRLRGAYVILDSSGTALLNGLCAAPHMVKPNLLELGQIVGRHIDGSDAEVQRAAKECLSQGVTRVVVSRGYRGIVVIETKQAWKAWLETGDSGPTAGVGSGDAVVAAFAVAMLQNSSIEDAMRLAVACGSANLLTKLPGRFRAADVADLVPQAQVRQVA